MNSLPIIYYWVGFIVCWFLAGALAVFLLTFPIVVIIGLWTRFCNSSAGNYWFAVKDLVHYLWTGRARWQQNLTKKITHDMVSLWNAKPSIIARLRTQGPYRRDLLAWIVRRQRAKNKLI